MSTVNELREKRGALVQEMHDLTGKTSFPEEAQKRWKELDVQQEALRVQIEAIEKSSALDAEMRKVVPPPAQPQVRNGQPETRLARTARVIEMRSTDEYRNAFESWSRTGQDNETLRELRTYSGLDSTTEPGGGDLVPISMQKEIEIKLKAFGGLRRNARVITTSTGNTLNWPTADDTANKGRFLAAGAPVSQTNPSFNQVQFTSNLCSSDQVLVDVQLLQDSAFPVEPLLNDLFGIRIGRALSDAYTNGTGSGEPKGLVPSITNLVTVVGDSATGNTDLNSIGVDDLSNVIAALDPAYRVNAKFMANQSTYDFMRKLKDTLGRPLWEVSIAQGVPDRILGYEYDWNQSMDAIGASKKSVVFGDFSKYVIRDVGGITAGRYNELYMPNHQVGFQAYLRTDGQCIQPAAFAALEHPAS